MDAENNHMTRSNDRDEASHLCSEVKSLTPQSQILRDYHRKPTTSTHLIHQLIKNSSMPSRTLFIRYPKNFKEKDYHQPNAYNYGQQFLEKMTIPSKALSFIDPHLGVGRSWPTEKFTVLIVTYHRENILKQILSQYKNLPFLDRIVLVWNAQDNKVNKSVIPDIGVPIHVISNGKNSLNNRFLPFEVIRTQAIFTVDDDITLENGDILFAFRVWRENRDRIVGFPARYHEWNPKKKKWFYSSGYKMGQSLILTGATFLHKHYFFLYSYVMNPAIRELVYKKMNCEDLAMNMLVAHVSKKSPMKTIRKQFFANKFKLKDGLSFKPKHKDKRDNCLNEFAQIYGYMPLIFTQYEADYLIGKQQYNNKFYRSLASKTQYLLIGLLWMANARPCGSILAIIRIMIMSGESIAADVGRTLTEGNVSFNWNGGWRDGFFNCDFIFYNSMGLTSFSFILKVARSAYFI
ncbi:EXTL3 [Acanthosepion pharaonis]|uniref:EXTL3 n=1 Tax=Acanthosepion pharaonis TaxID=158019 RepID=A0A812EML4_ACAPH|nr:EXTL3 [Sepia pharaonis]